MKKENGSHGVMRFVWGHMISNALGGLVLAMLLVQVALAAEPQSADLAQQVFDTMAQLPGNTPATRLVHATGIVCHGTFVPSKDAATLSRAIHFNSASVPVTVRFSNASPKTGSSDIAPDATPYGMAIRFLLFGDKKTDIVSFAHNGFPSGTGEDFLALQKSVVATDPSKPHPWPVEAFLSTHPRALKFVQDPKPEPLSFGTEAFFGNNAFIFVNKRGVKQATRYQILPVAGLKHFSDAESKANPPNYLIEELKRRLAKEPVKFRLMVQLPNAGDPTNDSSIVWPDDRKTVDLGTITVSSIDPDSDAVEKKLGFDPVTLTDGIELSDDPLPPLRSAVYMLSRIHRHAQ